MADYKKANRRMTDEQFSEGTTIDGSRIDKAIEDIIDYQNDIPIEGFEAQYMPVTYVFCWSPSRSWFKAPSPSGITGLPRFGSSWLFNGQGTWSPFLAARNWDDEVFPVAEQPLDGFENEWRTKGFADNPETFEYRESLGRGGTVTSPPPSDIDNTNLSFPSFTMFAAGAGINGTGSSHMNEKHMTATFPLYFGKPVILQNVSVFAAQEHPVSFFNSGQVGGAYYDLISTALPYKDGAAFFQANQFDYTSQPCQTVASNIEKTTGSKFDPTTADYLAAKTGLEYPGELWTTSGNNMGNATIQISLDNEFQKERRDYNNVIFTKFKIGNERYRFNRHFPTNNAAGHALPNSGGLYGDMAPEYPGGSTWGVWMKEDNLNIPIPRDSRARFSITTEGWKSGQLFEWHIAITVLEMIEK
jgi:hypothetical protein